MPPSSGGYRHQLEEFVAGSHLVGHFERHPCALLCRLHRAAVVVNLFHRHIHHAGGRTSDEHVVAHAELARLAGKLGHAELGEIFHPFAHIHLLFGGVVYYARTNFKNGQAIIEDEFGNMYFTNRNFSSRSKFNGYLETDYLFRYDASRNTLSDFPVDEISANTTAPEPYKKNDLYGYRSVKEVSIFPQFRNVSKFVKDVAIVENTKGKPGVITARNGYSMGYCTVAPVQKNIYAQRGHNAFIQFNVNEDESNVPIETMAVQHLSGKNSDLLDWNPINDTRYSATFTPTAEGENVFAVYFFSEDGFLVSENLLTYNFQYAAPLDYDINVGQASASSPHTVPVNVVISNPNSVSMSLDYDLLGSEGFHCDNSSGTISVPANGKYTLRGSFSVSKSVSGAWVILESNKETLAKRTNISMHCYVAPREKENPKKENNKEKPEKAGPKINTDNYGGGKPVIRN